MKRILALFMALTLFSLCSCGKTAVKTVDMDALSESMLAADTSLPEMKTTTAESDFQYLADMNYGKVDCYFLHYSAVATADEIAVIAMKDPADADDALNALQEHLEDRRILFNEYGPKEVQRIDNAVLFTEAQYAVLLICDHADAVKSAFEDALSD